jgi:hypothetical protein
LLIVLLLSSSGIFCEGFLFLFLVENTMDISCIFYSWIA